MRKMRNSGAKLLTALIAMVCITSIAAGASVSVDSRDVSLGDTFTIDVTVDPEGNSVYGAQYDLTFNQAILQVISQAKGGFLAQDGINSVEITNKFNNTIGKVKYGETRMGAEDGVTGAGVLATITFEAVSGGSTDILLSNVIVSDPSAKPISGVVLNNGTVNVGGSPQPLIDLTPTALNIPDPIYVDHDYTLDATISNLESGDASAFNVTLKVNGVVVDGKRVGGLSGNSDTSVSFSWRPETIGSCMLLVETDSNAEIDESDESNNSLSATANVLEEGATYPSMSVDSRYVSLGDTFTIDVTVDPEGNSVYGAQYDLTFNQAILQVVSQVKGGFLTQDGESSVEITNKFNNTIGKLEYGETRMGVTDGVTGAGVLTTITFEVVGVGSTDLEISNMILSDPSANPIDGVVLNDGTVNVVTTPPALSDAVVTIPDVSATGMITVPITIENVSDVGSCQLTLSYDPDVVIASSVDCSSDFDSLFANVEDAASGSVSILAYQTSNPGLEGDVIVANVTFMVIGAIGASTPLNLEVTTLTDATPECNPIPYSIRNGSFTVLLNGDVNGDGRVDVADCMFLAKHLLGVSGFETIIEDAADVNGNGMIEVSDCMYLAKHLAGMDGFEVLK